MSEQFQVCNLNGAEKFKSPKNCKIFPDTKDNKNMLRIKDRSGGPENFDAHDDSPSKAVDNVIHKFDTFSTNGHSGTKLVSQNGLFGPKTKASNRLSCSIDYRTATTENTGSLRRNKLSGRMGLGVGSKSGEKEEQKCFICDKEGITQVIGLSVIL